MDDRKFDSITRMIGRGASRRALLKSILGITGSVVAASALKVDVSSRERGSRPGVPTPPPYDPPEDCPEGQSGCNGNCCADGQCHSGVCCESGATACGGAGCCGSGLACCRDQNGNPKTCCAGSCTVTGNCCASGNAPCGGDCCSPDQQCCGGECCPNGALCIGDERCCQPLTCAELGVVCGVRDDGCGGAITCGDCDDGDPCTVNTCNESTGECSFPPVECPGNESCDPSAGACVCPAGFERCGGSGPCLASLETGCADDVECCSGACYGGRCIVPGDAGSTCNSDGDCAGALACCNGFCRDTLTDPNNCGASCQDCDDGDPCTTDTCDNGTCSAVPLVDGTGCGAGLACCGGVCGMACNPAEREVCDPVGATCVCDAANGYVACPDQCLLGLSESCSAHDECCSGVCHDVDDTCTDQCTGGGQSCSEDTECCLGACNAGSCVQCGLDGASCDSDPDCCTGFTCYNGSCVTFGTLCDGDADCETGFTCCGNTCVDTLTDAAHCGNCDDPCDANFDCVQGECTCTAGVLCGDDCVEGTCCPEDASCSDSQPCCEGFHCCDTNVCAECCENTDCAEDEFCDEGACATGCNDDDGCAHLESDCVSASCNTGDNTCETERVADGTDCSTGVCLAGVCMACIDTDDCPDLELCQESVECISNACEYQYAPDGNFCGQPIVGLCCSGVCLPGAECCDTETQAPQCPDNCSCNGGNCVCPFEGCFVTGDCSFGLRCCGTEEGRLGFCVECCEDGQCPAGERCELGECIACTANGQACSDGVECCSGACEGNICVATCAAIGESCDPEACCAGLICHTTGECVECTPESDSCPFGFTCDAGTFNCVQACLGPGETCSYDVDCCAWSCLSGRCLDRCVEEDGFCDSDADCCNLRLCIDDVCANPRNDGEPCEVDLHCESGKCCGGVCASPFDVAHCTACNAPCGIDEICCDNVCSSDECCFNDGEDEAHCPPPQLCSNFACECPVDGVEIVLCNGVCTDIEFDPQHCGGCDSPCTDSGRTACDDGICVCPEEDDEGGGTPCAVDDECCDFCYQNVCRTGCQRDGEPCTDDDPDCCGTCYLGQCVPRPQFGEPCGEEVECDRNLECNVVTGLCGRDNGELCSTDAECASNACIEGICCGSRCSGPCESCLAADTLWCHDGECCSLPIGSHTDACAEEENKVCIAGGQCACVAGGELFCDGSCAPAVCCNENQFCGENDECCGDLTCINGVCVPKSGLFGPCDTSLDCSHEGGVMLCTGDDLSHPFPSTCLYDLGAPCTPDAVEECDSQHCVDGVCCRDSCEEPCVACSVLLHQQTRLHGICLPVPEGEDPNEECPGDQVCDGSGGCTFI